MIVMREGCALNLSGVQSDVRIFGPEIDCTFLNFAVLCTCTSIVDLVPFNAMPETPVETRVATVLARQQRRERRIGLVLVFVGCVLLANAVVGEGGLVATIKAREDYRRASEGLARIEAENAGLREQARRLESDPATIEIYARRDLHLIKRGEILVQIQDVK